MKNIAMTFLMLLFVGVGTSMAQDKVAADSDAATTKTEMKADHKCAPGCEMACCTKGSAKADKKCAPECAKKCPSHASAATKEATLEAVPE